MTTQPRGPFDRILKTAESAAPGGVPDRAAIYIGGLIIGLGILLLVLILPPISILSGDGGGSPEISGVPGDADEVTSSVRSGMPQLPAGLVAASPFFDIAAPEDQRGANALTLPLKERATDANNMGLYSYIDSTWQRIADVTIVASGNAARGEVDTLPGNVAVLRRAEVTFKVAASIPAGTVLDPGAAQAITVLHPVVFIPSETGEVVGQPPAVPPASYEVVPGIIAFEPAAVDNIMRSTEVRNAHVEAIVEAVRQGNYAGINVGYQSISPALREEFTSFATSLADALHEDSRTLTLTLPMPLRVDGEIDTGAYDWEALGAAADNIEMSAELDQELYFQSTEAALEFVTERVDPGKILLSMTSLAVERGGDGIRQIGYGEALITASTIAVRTEGEIVPGSQVPLVAQNLATADGASGMTWDDTARAVTFSYPGLGGKRTMWIANKFSSAFRVELAHRYQLGGIVVSDASVEGGGSDVWGPIRELADNGSVTLSKPNGDFFAPSWSSSEGAVTPTIGDSVTWTAPGAGTHQVTVVISDGIVRLGQRVEISVNAPPPTE
jgi:hypothetical protein